MRDLRRPGERPQLGLSSWRQCGGGRVGSWRRQMRYLLRPGERPQLGLRSWRRCGGGRVRGLRQMHKSAERMHPRRPGWVLPGPFAAQSAGPLRWRGSLRRMPRHAGPSPVWAAQSSQPPLLLGHGSWCRAGMRARSVCCGKATRTDMFAFRFRSRGRRKPSFQSRGRRSRATNASLSPRFPQRESRLPLDRASAANINSPRDVGISGLPTAS